ncbi:unnamed protein product [Chironomus riparius]|uniref:Ionotropic receptor n=1 Tax=Chironomus riparius TaxID=315576 RepID=A0A9N9RUI0_9DIPT|nr:unnamed protein product [Chironomus riparius]
MIIMTDSLEYSLSILKYQLTVTIRWFIIVLSHCEKTSVRELDMQSALLVELLCYNNKSSIMMCVTPNWYRKFRYVISKIQNKYVNLDIKSLRTFKSKIPKSCSMTASAIIRPPFVYYKSSKNLTGIDVRILHELALSLNLDLQIFAFNTSNFTSNEFDVHVGYPLQYSKSISKSYDFHELVYVVAPGKRISSLQKLFQAFDGKIWILICLIILMAFMSTYAMNMQSHVIRKFVFGRNAQLKFMNVLGGLLGTSSHQLTSKRNFLRVLWIAFLFFGVLMRTLHQATLFKLLQNDNCENEVQSLDEAIEKNITVYTDVIYKDFVNQSIRIKYKSQREIHSIITKSFDSDFLEIIFLPSAQMNFFKHSSSQLKRFKIIEHPRIVIPSVFHFSDQFHFADEIDEKIGMFQSAGLIKFWTDLEMHHIHKVNEIVVPKKLTFKHVQILFDILIVGHSLSFMFFILELIYKRFVGQKTVREMTAVRFIRRKSYP